MPLISGLTVFENNLSNSLVALDNNFTTIANAVNGFGNSGSYLSSGATFITASGILVTGSTVPTNGMYLPAANTVGISANGILIFSVTGTTAALSQPFTGSVTFGDNPSNLVQTNPVAFRAHRAVSQTSGTTLIFDTVDNQSGGTNYNISTGVFTAPLNGWYIFSCNFNVQNVSGGTLGAIYNIVANGINVCEYDISIPNTITQGINMTAICLLSSTNTVSVVGPGGFASNIILLGGTGVHAGGCSFCGHLLSRTS